MIVEIDSRKAAASAASCLNPQRTPDGGSRAELGLILVTNDAAAIKSLAIDD
jgi:hypothetical protein